MSKFTIDQILAEMRGEGPELYGIEKEASTQSPSYSKSEVSDAEVEKMASFLKEAQVPEEGDSHTSFNEKLAAALLLHDTVVQLSKHAEEPSVPETSVEPEESEEDVKIASFIKNATAKGFSKEDILSLFQKQANGKALEAAKRLLSNRGVKAGLIAAGAGLSAAGGKAYGEKEEREKARSFFGKVMPKVYQVGLQRGFQEGVASK